MPASLSAVVISRNEGRELQRTVENFDDTLPAGAEIIVIDDGSTDGSADRVTRRRGRIRVQRVTDYGVARPEPRRQARGGVIGAPTRTFDWSDWWRPMLDVLDDPTSGRRACHHRIPRRPRRLRLTFRDARLSAWRRRSRGPGGRADHSGLLFRHAQGCARATGGWDDRQLQRGNVDNEGCVRF
jgi:hypothetical protein